MKLKILAFADFPSPYRVEVFKGLSKKYDMFIVFDKMSDQNRNSQWFCQNTGLNSISLLTDEGKKRFRKELRQLRKYDLVIAYDYHIKNAIILETQCIVSRVPYIMNLDGAFIRKNVIKNFVKRLLIRHAAGYFASGSHAVQYFEFFGAKKDKIFTHPFTSLHKEDILENLISSQDKIAYRKKLGLSEKKMVLSIGQFINRKGFDILLSAWSARLDEKAQLVIIGGGEEEDNYKKIIQSKKLKNVSLIGFQGREKIFEYYKAANLFVLPTREDIWGLVINEAMACGLPIISTNMCLAALELLDNECIVEVGNIHELESRMELFLQDSVAIQQGDKNLHKIRSYTYENVVEAHENAIESIVSGGKNDG